MKRTLERYYALFSANLQEAMVYRFAFFTNFLAEVVKTIVMLEVWMAVYRQRSTVAGFDYSMMVTYLPRPSTTFMAFGMTRSVPSARRSGREPLSLICSGL